MRVILVCLLWGCIALGCEYEPCFKSLAFVSCFLVICLNTNPVELYKEFDFFVNGLALLLGTAWPNQMYKAKNQTGSNFLGFVGFMFYFIFFSWERYSLSFVSFLHHKTLKWDQEFFQTWCSYQTVASFGCV